MHVNTSAVRGADPRSAWLTQRLCCSTVAPPLINDWTEQRQKRDQFLITINANAASFRRTFTQNETTHARVQRQGVHMEK